MAEASKKGNWFERNWGWVLGAVLLVAGIIGGMYWYKRRWRNFDTEGQGQYLQDQNTGTITWNGKQAYQFSNAGGVKGLSIGDTIKVEDPNGTKAFATGEMKILGLPTKKDANGTTTLWFVVTDAKAKAQNSNTNPGRLKFVKKAA